MKNIERSYIIVVPFDLFRVIVPAVRLNSSYQISYQSQ